MLADPCNAPMVQPCYNGTGSGYFVRMRQIVDIPAAAKDFVMEFTPAGGTGNVGAWSWSDTVGGSLGNAANLSMGGIFNSGFVGRARCVAGCAKILYTGTELNRSGIVGFSLDQGRSMAAGEPIAGTASTWLATTAHTERIGQREMEYRWLPGPGDENFRTTGGEELATGEVNGGGIQIIISGITPATVRITLVSVWEWQPEQEQNTGLVTQNKVPASRNSLNDVLRAIGDVGQFAVSATGKLLGFVESHGTTMRALGSALATLV